MSLSQKDLLNWVWVDTNTKLPLDKDSYSKIKEAKFKICLVCPERWHRPQDIQKYIDYMRQNNIKIDAVMTNKNYIPIWEKMN